MCWSCTGNRENESFPGDENYDTLSQVSKLLNEIIVMMIRSKHEKRMLGKMLCRLVPCSNGCVRKSFPRTFHGVSPSCLSNYKVFATFFKYLKNYFFEKTNKILKRVGVVSLVENFLGG